MTTKSHLASQDPTFEARGPMGIFLCNRTDVGDTNSITTPPTLLSGIDTSPQEATLTYGAGQPPPPWVQGTDWKVPAALSYAVLPDQFPLALSAGFWVLAGSACVMSVSDRSANRVALGAQYVFDQPFFLQGTALSMHFTISGIAGGSTVLPGFGLWNLGSRPGAWTYVTPTSFDGVWSIQLRSDDFFDYATLSVTYVRYSTLNSAPSMSRLFYSVSGSANATFPFPVTASHVIDAAPLPPIAPSDARSSIDIIRASTKFKEFTR
jgi:hypothetical protein